MVDPDWDIVVVVVAVVDDDDDGDVLLCCRLINALNGSIDDLNETGDCD